MSVSRSSVPQVEVSVLTSSNCIHRHWPPDLPAASAFLLRACSPPPELGRLFPKMGGRGTGCLGCSNVTISWTQSRFGQVACVCWGLGTELPWPLSFLKLICFSNDGQCFQTLSNCVGMFWEPQSGVCPSRVAGNSQEGEIGARRDRMDFNGCRNDT